MGNGMQGTVWGARRCEVNGDKIATVFLGQPASKEDPDMVGLEVMKASCPYSLLDNMAGDFPQEAEAQVKLRSAAGGKVGMEVLALRPASKQPTASKSSGS